MMKELQTSAGLDGESILNNSHAVLIGRPKETGKENYHTRSESADLTGIMLREYGKHSLLSREEEKILFTKLADYRKSIFRQILPYNPVIDQVRSDIKGLYVNMNEEKANSNAKIPIIRSLPEKSLVDRMLSYSNDKQAEFICSLEFSQSYYSKAISGWLRHKEEEAFFEMINPGGSAGMNCLEQVHNILISTEYDMFSQYIHYSKIDDIEINQYRLLKNFRRSLPESFDKEHANSLVSKLREVPFTGKWYDFIKKSFPGMFAIKMPEPEIEEMMNSLNDSENQALRHNIKLAVFIARKYIGRGLTLSELVQEGIFGLQDAIKRYEVSLGFKFSTYGTLWAKQKITRAICNQGSTIRSPVHIREKINKLKSATAEMRSEIAGMPTDDELADRLGWPVAYVRRIKERDIEIVSTENPVGNDRTIGDLLAANESFKSAEDLHLHEENKAIVYSMMKSTLKDKRQKIVLCMRFGLEPFFDSPISWQPGKPYALEEIADIFSVTRERIRQIESKAIRKMHIVMKRKKMRFEMFLK